MTAEPTTTGATARLTTTTIPEEAIILREDGLGPVTIGDAEDQVVAALVQVFGQPTGDLAHDGPFTEELRCSTALGVPCFDYLRIIEWDRFGLTVIISDWVVSSDTTIVEEPPNLRGFEYTGGPSQPTLYTERGITIGSTLEDLRLAYGADLHISEDPCAFDTEYGFTLRAGPTITAGLWGQLSREPVEGLVESIGLGAAVSNC